MIIFFLMIFVCKTLRNLESLLEYEQKLLKTETMPFYITKYQLDSIGCSYKFHLD